MKQKVIVLCASPYNFINDKTGELLQGVNVYVLLNDTLEPVDGERESKGYEPVKMVMPYADRAKFVSCPGFYMAKTGMAVKGHKAQLAITDIEYIAPIDVKDGVRK